MKDGSIVGEASRRRTFAIISHPDAGKTTMTEKLLLYGKAVNEAGAVEGGRKRKATTSDWMDLEKRRGISVSSTVLRFEHDDIVINLLDTPGHSDFSEDTLRVMSAVDGCRYPDRRRQGHREPDPPALRGRQEPRHPPDHLHQ